MRHLAFVLLFAPFVACRSDLNSGVIRADSSGVEIVTSAADDILLDWSLDTITSLGGSDSGPGAFYQVQRDLVTVGDDGSIFVLDPAAFRVVRIDAAGRAEHFAGSNGDGPGELKRPTALNVSPSGNVVVVDAGRRRIIWYDSTGAFVEERDAASLGSFVALADRAIVARRFVNTRVGTRQILVREHESGVVDTLTSTDLVEFKRIRLEGCPMGAMMAPPIFEPQLVWYGLKDAVAISASPQYIVDVMSTDGQRQSIRRTLDAETATEAAAVAWAELHGPRVMTPNGECRFPAEDVVEARGFFDAIPTIVDLVMAPNGTLLVHRRVSETELAIDVFEADGAYRGTLPKDFPFPMMFTSSGAVLLTSRDADDVERVVVAHITE